MSTQTASIAQRRFRDVAADYFSLTKPTIIIWLEITTVAGMVMAARGWPSTGLVLATVVGGWLAASASHVINCWYDRDIDSEMRRTHARPLGEGRIDPKSALVFGILLIVLANVVFLTFVNLLADLYSNLAFAIYVGIYTVWLKRRSVNNIVIGGAAGALPPLIGWVAVQNSVSIGALCCFATVFYWTPPHFWALALLVERDYSTARVPMLPVVRGQSLTRLHILFYTIILSAVTMVPFITGTFGTLYLFSALALDAAFVGLAVWCRFSQSKQAARTLFFYSLAYLALLFGAMAADRVLHI